MARTRAQNAAPSKSAKPAASKSPMKQPSRDASPPQPNSAKKRKKGSTESSSPPTKKSKNEEPKPSSDHHAILGRLLSSSYAISPLEDLSVSPSSPEPEKALALLLNALLSSARLSHSIAHSTAKRLVEAKYHQLEVLEKSTWEERTEVLTEAGYTRYREKTATALGNLATWLREEYDGDLSNLRDRASSSPQKIRALLKEIKGLGDVGVDIFFGSVQGTWTCLAPFIDARNVETAEKIGLGSDVDRIYRGVGADAGEMCKVNVTLTMIRLEKKEVEFV